MDYKEILYTKADGVATITLNRPQALNALTPVMTCRIFDAQEALQMGYVQKVVPHDELQAATNELATQLAKGPSVAMQLAKRLIYRAYESHLEQALEDVEWGMVITQNCEDAKEGPRAWVEKRAPVFKGR